MLSDHGVTERVAPGPHAAPPSAGLRAYRMDLEVPAAARSMRRPIEARVGTRSAGTPSAFFSTSEIRSPRSLLKTLLEPRLASRTVSSEISTGLSEPIECEAPSAACPRARRVSTEHLGRRRMA